MEFTLSTPNAIRGDQLADEINIAVGTSLDLIDDITFYPPLTVSISSITEDPGEQIQTVITAHVPDLFYFDDDKVKNQSKEGITNLKQLYTGLSGLSARDASYALLGRTFAYNDDADNQTILGITNKNTAAAYMSGKSEWDNLPIEAKQWLTDELEVLAILFQGLLTIIRG